MKRARKSMSYLSLLQMRLASSIVWLAFLREEVSSNATYSAGWGRKLRLDF